MPAVVNWEFYIGSFEGVPDAVCAWSSRIDLVVFDSEDQLWFTSSVTRSALYETDRVEAMRAELRLANWMEIDSLQQRWIRFANRVPMSEWHCSSWLSLW